MSLMIVSSASLLWRMTLDEVALLLVERHVEQQACHADHRVHGRADLVAHARQEEALGAVGSFRRSAARFQLPLDVLERVKMADDVGVEQQNLLLVFVDRAVQHQVIHDHDPDHLIAVPHGCSRVRAAAHGADHPRRSIDRPRSRSASPRR
jgi:hypothetical protein